MSAKELTVDLVIRYGFQVLGAIIILGVGLLAARWLGNITERWLERRAMEPPARKLAVRGVRLLVLVFALLVALDKFGFQIAPLVAGIGVAGLGVGIALQGVLGNLVAGFTIIFTKPFRLGEYVELVGVQGQVTAIELFSTTLTHPDRSRVVIPNRKIVGEVLRNFGAIRQLDLTVDVPHGTDLNRALSVVRDVVRENPRVLKDLEPVVGVAGLSTLAVTIEIRPWVSVADDLPARAELYQAIAERFRASEIEIPFSRHEVRLLAGSGAARLDNPQAVA